MGGEAEGEFELVVGDAFVIAVGADLVAVLLAGLVDEGLLELAADALAAVERVDAEGEDFGFGEGAAVEGERWLIEFGADRLDGVAEEAEGCVVLVVGDEEVGTEMPIGREGGPAVLVEEIEEVGEVWGKGGGGGDCDGHVFGWVGVVVGCMVYFNTEGQRDRAGGVW